MTHNRNWMRYPVLLAAGALQALSLAWPWGGSACGGLQIAALTVLAVFVHRANKAKQVFIDVWVFSCAWLTGSVWWLFISMHTYGGMPAPMAGAALLALTAALALFYALALMGLPWVLSTRTKAPDNAMQPRTLRFAASFAALHLLAELARGTWFTGFPWGAIGYAHVDSLLAAYAPWVGVYGMGAVAAFLAGCFAHCLSILYARHRAAKMQNTGHRNFKKSVHNALNLLTTPKTKACNSIYTPLFLLAVAVLPISSLLNITPGFTQSTGHFSVALLQGNVPQAEKFEAASGGIRRALDWYQTQLLSSTADLSVTPETALPLLPEHLPAQYLGGLNDHFLNAQQRSALVGLPMQLKQAQAPSVYTNSLIALGPHGLSAQQPYRYNKHHLVPFGEFIPPFFRWFTDLMQMPLADFSSGTQALTNFQIGSQTIAPNICYEDLFGEELAQRMLSTPTSPNAFVNASNIAWFGNTVAIDQHLHISRMRSLELERPMLRATNTGATAIINHLGQIESALPRHTQGVLTGRIDGRTGVTPYTLWVGHFGLAPFYLLVMMLLILSNQKYLIKHLQATSNQCKSIFYPTRR
jgi:apolipoprotein N-acyltransferase